MNNFDLKKYLAEGRLFEESESLKGKTINLVRTLHTIGKYNDETGEMDKVTQTKNMTGTIGDINSFPGSTGFWFMDDAGKKLGYVMYDPEIGKFIEGESSFHYEYEGQSPEDQELLDQFKGQSVSENTLNERISFEEIERMEELANIQDLETLKAKLRILSSDWMNEGFEKEDVINYMAFLIDNI